MIRPEDHISPEHLFLAGILVLPAFLFSDSIMAKIVMMFMYLTFSALSGRRVRLLPNVIAAAGIIAANLLTPFGKIYLYIGTFRFTEGALRLGALKAATLIGLIYLSRLTVRSSLRFPGRLGELLALTLYYFERITEQKVRLARRDFWKNLDALLRRVYEDDAATADVREKTRTRPLGYASAAVFIALNWFLFAAGR